MDHKGNDDTNKYICLWVALVDLNVITVINLCLVGCSVKTVVERLIPSCVEGDQRPNADGDLESKGDRKHKEVCLDKLIFSHDSPDETVLTG